MGLVTATAGVEDWTGNGPSLLQLGWRTGLGMGLVTATAGVEDWTGNGPSHCHSWGGGLDWEWA